MDPALQSTGANLGRAGRERELYTDIRDARAPRLRTGRRFISLYADLLRAKLKSSDSIGTQESSM